MADGTGRSAQDILKDIVRVLTTSNSLEEAQVPDITNATSQINPSSSSVVTQAVARLFPGTFTRTTAASTSRPAKSKKRPHDPTRRDSGFFLKDVMLLPSPSVTKIPRGKLRETLHMEGYAASAVEFCSDWSERKLRSALEAVFKDKLDGLPAPMWVWNIMKMYIYK